MKKPYDSTPQTLSGVEIEGILNDVWEKINTFNLHDAGSSKHLANTVLIPLATWRRLRVSYMYWCSQYSGMCMTSDGSLTIIGLVVRPSMDNTSIEVLYKPL